MAVRRFLARRGMKKGELAKFIEEAVRWRVFDETLRETKARNVHIPPEEVDSAIDEALAAVRAERFVATSSSNSTISVDKGGAGTT